MYFWLFDWNFFPRFLKDSGVIGLLHFFSRWLLWAITLPFKLLLGAALRLGSLKMIDYYEMRSSLFLIVYLFHFFFGWGGGGGGGGCCSVPSIYVRRQFTNTFVRVVP